MTVNNPPKLVIILAVCVSVVILMALGRIGPSEGMPILTLFAGYGVGNGVAAKRGEPVEPAFGPKPSAPPAAGERRQSAGRDRRRPGSSSPAL